MLKKTYAAIVLLVLTHSTMAPPALADDVIIGKVVSVADGDTITVLVNQTQHRIRLYGIDAPERRQDFNNRAKQLFVSELVFGKQVRVVKKPFSYLRYVFERLPMLQAPDEYRCLLPQYIDRSVINTPAS